MASDWTMVGDGWGLRSGAETNVVGLLGRKP
jgi:hypothetical protein